MVGPIGVVNGPFPMGGPVPATNTPTLGVVAAQGSPSGGSQAPAAPPPTPLNPSAAAPLAPSPLISAMAPSTVAPPVDQAALVQTDNLDGLGGNADVNVTPIDNSAQSDPSANSGDQPQT